MNASLRWAASLAVLAALAAQAPAHADATTGTLPGPKVQNQFAVHLPAVRETHLKNGIRVLFAERHDLPIVAVRVVSTVGAADAPPGVAELAASTAVDSAYRSYWRRNLKRMNLTGARLAASSDYNGTTVTARTLAPQFEDAVLSLSEVVRVQFPDADLVRQARKQSIDALEAAMKVSANYAARELVYPASHPYHYLERGTAAAIRALEPEPLRAHWARAFTAANVTVVASGAIEFERLTAGLERALGDLPAGAAIPPSAPLAEPLGERHGIVLLHEATATQAQLTVVGLGVPYTHSDRRALRLALTQLGRELHDRIRERYGSSYGVDATLEAARGTAPLWVYGSVENGQVATALRTVLDTITELREKGLPGDFEASRAVYLGDIASTFENASESASNLAGLARFGLPVDDNARALEQVRALTPDAVREAANKYIDPVHMRVVVVGDAAVVGPELEKAGLGPIEIRNGPPPKASPR